MQSTHHDYHDMVAYYTVNPSWAKGIGGFPKMSTFPNVGKDNKSELTTSRKSKGIHICLLDVD